MPFAVRFLSVCVALSVTASAFAERKDAPTTAPASSISPGQIAAFRSRLVATETRHLDLMLHPDGKVADVRGKSTAGVTAMAYYLMYESTGNARYRAAALEMSNRILADMKATKFGVMYIKEKENAAGEKFGGGGPPAFGWYTATLGYVFHKEGNRDDDLKYVATVVDKFPWNDQGWWSADVDVKTGVSKQPMTKPSPVNKNASVALAAAMLGDYVKTINPELSARLKQKADCCIYKQLLPAQEPDGFWHYGLNESNDPGNKDILGYFMVTMEALVQLQEFTPSYRDPAFTAAMERGASFAMKNIAPMTEPNKSNTPSPHKTGSTPARYTLPDDLKRSFQLGSILLATGRRDEGIRVIDFATKFFPYGNLKEDGAHAAGPTARIIRALSDIGAPP